MNNGASARRALVCALDLPEFDRESGSKRVFDLVELLREAGWSVSFLAARPGEERYARMLQQRGVPVYQGFDDDTPELLRFGRFEIAIFGSWHVAEDQLLTLREVSPRTRIVVDVPDLNWLRNLRQSLLQRRVLASLIPVSRDPATSDEEEPEPPSEDAVPDFPWLMLRELDTYIAADAVFTVSEKEAQMLHDLLGEAVSAHAVPDIEDLAASDVPPSDRQGIAFIGNFRHAPNLDALVFFCEEVIPRIDPQLLERHPVSIIGNEPNEDVLRYQRMSPHVRVVGWVPTLAPYLHRARVSVVPLRYGAGTKRKLLQALTAGTPVVSTSIGVEGLNLVDGEHVLVADDPETFARCVESLIRDDKKWKKLAGSGGGQIAKLHGREAVRARLSDALTATFEKTNRRGRAAARRDMASARSVPELA